MNFRYATVMLLLRILILFIGVHTYIFLSGFVYHYLEQPAKAHPPDAVARVVEQNFMVTNGPKKSKQEIVKLLKGAFAEDERNRIRGEFSSLWKCYLFSLTSMTTVGGLRIEIHITFIVQEVFIMFNVWSNYHQRFPWSSEVSLS